MNNSIEATILNKSELDEIVSRLENGCILVALSQRLGSVLTKLRGPQPEPSSPADETKCPSIIDNIEQLIRIRDEQSARLSNQLSELEKII